MKKFNVGKTYKRYSSTGKLMYTVKVQNRIDLKNDTSVIDYTITKHYTSSNNKEIVNEPIHSNSVIYCSDTTEVLFDTTYYVIIHPAEHDSTRHIKYRQYLYKVCTNKDYFASELHNIKKYDKVHDIRHLLLNLVLVTCNGILKYNFSELTTRDAMAIVIRGTRAIVQELTVIDITFTNYEFIDKYLIKNIPTVAPNMIFIDVCILYSRYHNKFEPSINELIELVLGEYRDH